MAKTNTKRRGKIQSLDESTMRNELSLGWRRRSSATLGSLSNNGSTLHVVDFARRRLSGVTDAVSKTIGWSSATPIDAIIRQGSALTGRYIINRLKRSGIHRGKLGLRRLKSILVSTDGSIIAEICPVLIALGTELEKMHPHLFVRVARQVGCRSFATEVRVTEVISDVSREMFRSGEMTWGKVVALFSVAGGLAVDCVYQGHPEFIPSIQRAMSNVFEGYLAIWIQANGGWTALSERCQVKKDPNVCQRYAMSACGLLLIIFVSILLHAVLSIL